MVKKVKFVICFVILVSIACITVAFLIHKNSLGAHTPNKKEESVSQETLVEETEKPIKERLNLATMVDTYILQNKLEDKVFMYISGLTSDDTYMRNMDTNVFAASVYKLPLAMIYYEKINAGTCKLSDTLVFQSSQYENEELIGNNVKAGTVMNLETLLKNMIVYSDNTAAHMLYEDLGGWVKFKQQITKYSSIKENKLSFDNVFNARYMNDVLRCLYEKRVSFETLLRDMKEPTSFSYLSENVNVEIAQKYGLYNGTTNSVGIVFAPKPYSIVIFTSLDELKGKDHIGKINEICYTYFSQ